MTKLLVLLYIRHHSYSLIWHSSALFLHYTKHCQHIYKPVTGIPEKPCVSLMSKISFTRALGPTATGSMIKPCSKRLTSLTSFAWASIEQLWWTIPIPPCNWKKNNVILQRFSHELLSNLFSLFRQFSLFSMLCSSNFGSNSISVLNTVSLLFSNSFFIYFLFSFL